MAFCVHGEEPSEEICCGLEMDCDTVDGGSESIEAQCCSAGYDCGFDERALSEAEATAPSDGPGDSPTTAPSAGPETPAAVASITFSMTIAAEGFDPTNTAHKEAFKTGLLSGLSMPSSMMEHVDVEFTEVNGRLRRLSTSYTADVTINVPEDAPVDFDPEVVTTALESSTIETSLGASLQTAFENVDGVNNFAVDAVTAVVTVTQAPASDDSSTTSAATERLPTGESHAPKQCVTWAALAAVFATLI